MRNGEKSKRHIRLSLRLPLKMGHICYLKTSVTKYKSKLRDYISLERIFQAEFKLSHKILGHTPINTGPNKLQSKKREVPRCYSVMENMSQATKHKMSVETSK
jgi:hypothetical protein